MLTGKIHPRWYPKKYPNPKLDESVRKSINLMEEAEEDIRKAMCLISKAVAGTGRLERSVNVYLLGWLRNCIGEGNPYDESTQKVIQLLKET